MLTLSFKSKKHSGSHTTQITLKLIPGLYKIFKSKVPVNSITKEDFNRLNKFLRQFAKSALRGQILPDNTVNTIDQYLTSYAIDLSCDKLVQYGIINNGETYVYSDMDAQRLAISNFDVETNGFIVNTVTIALNLFVQDGSSGSSGLVSTSFLAFSKMLNGGENKRCVSDKIITLTQNLKLKFEPFAALKLAITKSGEKGQTEGFVISELDNL